MDGAKVWFTTTRVSVPNFRHAPLLEFSSTKVISSLGFLGVSCASGYVFMVMAFITLSIYSNHGNLLIVRDGGYYTRYYSQALNSRSRRPFNII